MPPGRGFSRLRESSDELSHRQRWLAFWLMMALSFGKSTAIHSEVAKQLSSARRKILAWNRPFHLILCRFNFFAQRLQCFFSAHVRHGFNFSRRKHMANSADPERLDGLPNLIVRIWRSCSVKFFVQSRLGSRRLSLMEGLSPVSFW